MANQEGKEIIRYIPMGEIKIYGVSKHELTILAAGSSSSLYLNLAIALLSIGISIACSISFIANNSSAAFLSFLIFCIVSIIAGLIFLIIWCFSKKTGSILREILSRDNSQASIINDEQDAAKENK